MLSQWFVRHPSFEDFQELAERLERLSKQHNSLVHLCVVSSKRNRMLLEETLAWLRIQAATVCPTELSRSLRSDTSAVESQSEEFSSE